MNSLNDMLQSANRAELMAAIHAVRTTAEDYSRLSDSLAPAANRLPRVAENLNATLESTRRLTQELANPNGTVMRTVDNVGHDLQGAASSVQSAAGTFSEETLPQLNGLARDARQTARTFERAAGQFNESPSSVLFGAPAPAPVRASRASAHRSAARMPPLTRYRQPRDTAVNPATEMPRFLRSARSRLQAALLLAPRGLALSGLRADARQRPHGKRPNEAKVLEHPGARTIRSTARPSRKPAQQCARGAAPHSWRAGAGKQHRRSDVSLKNVGVRG